MTIAACAVTAEGIVLGADSTSTLTGGNKGDRYLNNEQKLFEIGESSTLGLVTWGVGRIGTVSYRTLVAQLADDLAAHPLTNVIDVANAFAAKVWPLYNTDPDLRARINAQKAIVADPQATAESKQKAKVALSGMSVGFCIGGHCLPNREPQAYELIFEPNLAQAPVPASVPAFQFWGANLFIYRLLGFEMSIANELLASGKWNGTPAELNAFFEAKRMPILAPIPLRETVDVVNALLHMTIKVMKFTSVPPVCGGHIELATITTDRRFRWVRHKNLAAALDHP